MCRRFMSKSLKTIIKKPMASMTQIHVILSISRVIMAVYTSQLNAFYFLFTNFAHSVRRKMIANPHMNSIFLRFFAFKGGIIFATQVWKLFSFLPRGLTSSKLVRAYTRTKLHGKMEIDKSNKLLLAVQTNCLHPSILSQDTPIFMCIIQTIQ